MRVFTLNVQSGLVHLSEVQAEPFDDVNQILREGDHVFVKVTKFQVPPFFVRLSVYPLSYSFSNKYREKVNMGCLSKMWTKKPVWILDPVEKRMTGRVMKEEEVGEEVVVRAVFVGGGGEEDNRGHLNNGVLRLALHGADMVPHPFEVEVRRVDGVPHMAMRVSEGEEAEVGGELRRVEGEGQVQVGAVEAAEVAVGEVEGDNRDHHHEEGGVNGEEGDGEVVGVEVIRTKGLA